MNLKHLVFFLFLFFYLNGCLSTKPSVDVCNGFKNGSYIQYMYNNSGLGHWTKMTLYIERNDSLQITTREYPISDTTISRLKWLSPCKYNLLWLNPQTHLDSTFLKVSPNGITYLIKEVTSKYILVKSNSQLDTLWKRN